MTDNFITVPIGELVVSDSPNDVLIAYGLGSCVAICLYDPVIRAGGMLHALLPAAPSNNHRDPGKPTKFVNLGLPLLIDSLIKMGSIRSRLQGRLCGGARMINAPGFDESFNVGRRNIRAARDALKAARIRIQAQSTGGHSGRTVRFYIDTGKVVVKTLGKGERVLV